jgi:F0F1-type ATP synthase assembly protein I
MADSDKAPKDPSLGSSMARAQPYIDASWQFIGGVGLGTFGGWWLDKRFHTTPWLLVVGAFLGMAAGFFSFMRVLSRLSARDKARTDTDLKDRS